MVSKFLFITFKILRYEQEVIDLEPNSSVNGAFFFIYNVDLFSHMLVMFLANQSNISDYYKCPNCIIYIMA